MSSTDPNGRGERPSGRVWRFADCEFDEPRRDLRVHGLTVDIEVKPLAVLHQLLLHAGEVVTKTELLESVWPGVVVVDGSLATAISKVRKVLGDDGTVIATVPRVGYKLAVPVHSQAVSTPAWPDLHLEPGESVPHREQWRLARRLDLSPSSEVWLAEHPKLHQARVFKFALDDARLKGLKREVTVARLLRESLGDRDEFVRVLEWNFEKQPYFIETEYAGPDLADWAEAQGGIGCVPLETRLKLLTKVADAVAAAHSVDVLHKDLKPGNILVVQASEGVPGIKIADFGSASLLAPSRLSAFGITNLGFTQSAAGEPVSGTVTYVAPEVLAGQSPTASSDVYALGVLLYQLIVADFRRPFAPGWEADVGDALLRDDVAAAASGDTSRRLHAAAELTSRLVGLDRRRLAREQAVEREQVEFRRRQTGAVRRRWLAVAALAALAAVVTAGLTSRRSEPPRPPRTVAVLPFGNTSSNASADFLRVALPDQIATILSRSRGLRVRPFAATSADGQTDVDIQHVGRKMGADTVLTGRFRKDEDQLHITLEAIDVASNALLWRDNLDASVTSMIGTRLQMVVTLQGTLIPLLGGSVAGAPPEPRNEAAFESFLASFGMGWDPTLNPKGIVLLEESVKHDPTYGPAWLTLARRYYVEAHWGSGNRDMMTRFVNAVERAVKLDPEDITAAATLVLGRIERGELDGAHERAADLARRQPDNVVAQFMLSYVLRYAGLLEQSATHCEKALLIDPLPVGTNLRSCALVFLVRGDHARALTYLNLDRESETGKAFRLEMLVRDGQKAAALDLGVPQVPQWKAEYELFLACVERKPADEIAKLAQGVLPAADPEENYLFAAHLSYCGLTDAARMMLQRAIDGNYCSYPAVESDPLFAALRATPEYAEIRAAAQNCQNRFLTAITSDAAARRDRN